MIASIQLEGLLTGLYGRTKSASPRLGERFACTGRTLEAPSSIAEHNSIPMAVGFPSKPGTSKTVSFGEKFQMYHMEEQINKPASP
jgi:hypothetical protein